MNGRPDVVVVGLGWAGSVVATELALAGHSVVALERGPNFDPEASRAAGLSRAEFVARHAQRVKRETFTLRHGTGRNALPFRTLGSFLAGEGVGGAGVLWGGNSPRLSEGAFRARTLARKQLGFDLHEDGVRLADWPFGFEDLEPDLQWFEEIIGVAGEAGVVGGMVTGRGNPQEGPRSGAYPVVSPALDDRSRFVGAAAEAVGLHPYAYPSADIEGAYTNLLGVERSWNGARHVATPLNTLPPAARATGNLRVVTGANVRRLVKDGGRITSVVYRTPDGDDHEISAPAVVVTGWTLNTVRLLLLSGVGQPYDPVSERGAVGRNLGNHLRSGVTAFFPDGVLPPADPHAGAGIALSDFDPHGWSGGPRYVGGALLASFGRRFSSGHRAAAPDDVPAWGAEWAQAVDREKDNAVSVYVQGDAVPQRDRYLDLDPVYRDTAGDPLLRLTFTWSENDRRLAADLGHRVGSAFEAAGARHVNAPLALAPFYDTVEYQNSHATGGAIAGSDPETSVVDADLRCHDAQNLWVVGASAFPNAGAANPTVTVGALARRASRAVTAAL